MLTSEMTPIMVTYLLPVVVIWSLYMGRRSWDARRNKQALRENVASGLTEPQSLHPVINHNRCIGCGSCINACPEQAAHPVLGLIQGKCHVIGPSYCIGHGACKTACPMDAITLVFGTETRGVDIPSVSADFETNVPGLFIAGELGGMGLIGNAIEQGRQAMNSIRKYLSGNPGLVKEVCVVGAGPAGFSATLAARELKLKCVTLEQETLGGTVAHYPRGKIVMTRPVRLPMVGPVRFRETTKEELISFWQKVERQSGVKIRYRERVDSIERTQNGFVVITDKGTYRAGAVLLAIGRRGTPRKLEVPGETLPKVVYRLIDAEQYAGRRVLVVGGGDSALEAAASIAEQPGTVVTLSYRSPSFSRAKEKNRNRVAQAERAGRLKLLLESQVQEIAESDVRIACKDGVCCIENDAVIVCAGGVLPTGFLKKTGVHVETKFGTA